VGVDFFNSFGEVLCSLQWIGASSTPRTYTFEVIAVYTT
jgi:hypothetical protein